VRKYRLAVCKGPDCRRGGANAVYEALRGELAQAKLEVACNLSRGGCYGLCQMGPNVVLRPDFGQSKDPFSPENFQLMGWEGEFHYPHMTALRVSRLVREHIALGKPVLEYLSQDDTVDS
jgi:(2Fe-2S) ferredoxin